MDREIEMSGWKAEWITREFPALHYYTVALSYVLSIWMLFIGGRTLYNQRKCRRELEHNPSTRTAVLAAHDKRLLSSTRTVFGLSLVFLIHTLAIWTVDAGIGIFFLKTSISDHPYEIDGTFLLELANMTLTFTLYMVAAFVLFPLLQMILVTLVLTRVHKRNNSRTLSAFIPEARIVSTHMAQLWLMLGYFIVAWWPVEDNSTLRIVAVEAALGSGFAWLDASFAFNFCYKRLADVEFAGNPGVAQLVKLFGSHVKAAHSKPPPIVDTLPQYEDIVTDEKLASEHSME